MIMSLSIAVFCFVIVSFLASIKAERNKEQIEELKKIVGKIDDELYPIEMKSNGPGISLVTANKIKELIEEIDRLKLVIKELGYEWKEKETKTKTKEAHWENIKK